MTLAHGGAAGAFVELALVLVLALVGAVVWWRSRRESAAGHDREAEG